LQTKCRLRQTDSSLTRVTTLKRSCCSASSTQVLGTRTTASQGVPLANTFIIRWPGLGKQVRCDKIGHNQHIFDWWVEQLPIITVQSHTVVSGWCLRMAVRTKTTWPWEPGGEVREDMSLSPDGRMKIQRTPAGEMTSVLIKYGERTENLHDMTFANVREEDLPTLREVGALVWSAVVRTKEIILAECVQETPG
jgi:hypothetical protein